MLNFTEIFFIILSILAVIYIIYSTKFRYRFHILIESFFILFYSIILIIFLFPKSLELFENTFGITSAIHFFIYLGIFVLYFLMFLFYKKTEEQRIQITKLIREISYLRREIKQLKNKEKRKTINMKATKK